MARQVVSVFVNLWLRDLGIVLSVAKASKFLAPLPSSALQHFLATVGQGLGGEGAIAKVQSHDAGIKLPKMGKALVYKC